MNNQNIKFRGKNIKTGEWVYGYYYEHQLPLECIVPKDYVPEKPKSYILKTGFADWNMPRPVEYIEVDPETVGQCTGIPDKEDKEICENDIVSAFDGEIKAKIIYGFCGFEFEWITKKCIYLRHRKSEPMFSNTSIIFEVIGNIYDNPELLEE